MIEGKIDVNDDKIDKEPQEKVMPEAHAEFSTHHATTQTNIRGSHDVLMLE